MLINKAKRKKKSFFVPEKAARVRLVTSRAVVNGAESRSGSSEYKLHVVMDKESFMRLRGLKAQLEASTEAEVVRRALKAYEIFEPDDESSDDPVGPNPGKELAGKDVEDIYIRISNRMKDRLDIVHKATGRTYSQQVRQALRVFTQLTRELTAYQEQSAERPVSEEKEKGVSDVLRSIKMATVC